jgi:phage terminase large subunit GpA-like protein
MSTPTTPTLLGLSRDLRTHRWSLKCPACGHDFQPETTMFATQVVNCPKPKCGKRLFANYNAEPPICKEAQEQNQ